MRWSRVLQAAAAVLLGILVLSPVHAATIHIPADYLTIAEGLAADSPCLPQNNDCNLQMGALGQGCHATSGVDDELPSVTRLVQNTPKPFNPHTVITFELARQEAVTLFIYDPSGRRVRNLIAGEIRSAGDHHITWDGRNDSGRELPSGIYLYRLTSSSGVETKR